MHIAENFNAIDFDLINTKLQSKKLRIDVGTSMNSPVSKYWLDHFNDIFVIAIEANPNALDKPNIWNHADIGYITCNVKGVIEKHRQTDEYYYINGACDNVDALTEVDFHVMTEDPGTSSLLKPILPNLYPCALKEIVRITSFSLKMLLEKVKVDYVELLKIDTQGKDLDVVKGLKEYIEKVAFIDVENDASNQYEGACRFYDLHGYLSNNGFTKYEDLCGNSRYKNNRINNVNLNSLTGNMS